jgi:hypothetical protein
VRIVFEPRSCDFCGRVFVPRASHQRFCCYAHQVAGRRSEERVLYHNTQHRRERRSWEPIVAEGGVVGAAPNGCHQLILAGERWDLGHLPGGVRHPQHARCNRKTAGKRSAVGRVW